MCESAQKRDYTAAFCQLAHIGGKEPCRTTKLTRLACKTWHQQTQEEKKKWGKVRKDWIQK